MTDFPTDLSYACIDVKPMDYTFSGERWAEATGDESGWRVCAGSILPSDLETEIALDDGRTLEFDSDTCTIEVTTTRPDADGNEDEDIEHFEPGDDGYDDLAKHFKLDGDEIRSYIDEGPDHGWEPMMNYAYPLGAEPPDDWKTRMVTCTCVEIDGEYYLALTGGGMDLSWEICETFMRLGYWPPAHFARLPEMAGRGTSDRDKWLIEGCRKSLEGMRDRIERDLRALDGMIKSAEEYEAERAQRT